MKHNKVLFIGIVFLFFTSSFINLSIDQQAVFINHEKQPVFISSLNANIDLSEAPSLPYLDDREFIKSVLEETARILGWQDHFFRSSTELAASVNPNTGIEDYDDPNRLSLSIQIRPVDEYDSISPNDPDITSFHNYTASYGSPFQDWETSLIWNMEGYHFWVYGSNVSHSGPTPNVYPYGEALYQAFWNVVEGKTGDSGGSPPAPENPPSDLCGDVTCRNNYCKDDGSKYLYDCACDPSDGKCRCRADTCEFGCDEYMGGCIPGESDLCSDVTCPDNFCSDDGSEFFFDCYCDEGDCYCDSNFCDAGCDIFQGGCLAMEMADPDDICAHTVCPEDYCEDDGKTRVYDCKCDPADGECGCYVEICEAGCNVATGKCVESMVIPGNVDDTGNSGGGYTPSPEPDGPGLLGVLGGVIAGGGVLAGGGYLSFKAIQGALARRAAKAAAKAAEPSLSELLAEAEKSANRASEAIDQAIKGTTDDVRNYKDFVSRTTRQNEAWANTMAQRAKLIERAESGVRAIKKGADVSAEILGNVPGAGTTFKYTYNLSITAAESIASGDSVGTVALKTASKGLETAVGDKLFGKVTVLDNLPKDLSKSTIKQAFKKVGAENLVTEALKNEGTNNMMNIMKEIKTRSRFGKVEKAVEKAAKKVDRKYIGKAIKKVFYK